MSEFTETLFPSDRYEALAMIYVQNQDLSNVSPYDLLDLYEDAYEKICRYAKSKQASKEDWIE